MKQLLISALISVISVSAHAAVDIAVGMTGPAQARVATTLSYTFNVRNLGNSRANSVIALIGKPAGLVASTVASGCSSISSTQIRCQLGNMNAGQVRALNFGFVAPAQAGSLTLAVSVTTSSNEPVNQRANNSASLTTQILAPSYSILIQPPQNVIGYLCWDAARGVDDCQSYALDSMTFRLDPQGDVATGDPSVRGEWVQSASDRLNVKFFDIASGNLLVEYSMTASSAACFDGIGHFTSVSPSDYSARICLQ